MGLFNTRREKNFYKVVAHVGGQKFVINKPDWENTTQLVWRFATTDDTEVRTSQLQLKPYSSIIY